MDKNYQHIQYMKRAIALSKKGIGYVNPNPLVGAVIVKDGRIIGEGYHEFYGGAHAEVNAFKNAIEDVAGAHMYVTLEPCSHFGKTPPCVDKIIENKISKVFVGLLDPNPLVMGRGIQKLIDNGIEVKVGLLDEQISKLNEIFLKYITTKQPFCIMKTAMTLDGKIATTAGDSKWITNEKSRNYVHQVRNRVAAIMVGIGTVLHDNPSLTTRLVNKKSSDPIRIIVDSNGRLPLDSTIFKTGNKDNTIIVVTEKVDLHKLEVLREKLEVIIVPEKDGLVDLKLLFKTLGEKGIDSILLEGGGNLNFSALEAKLVDKLLTFIAPKILGGKEALTPVEGQGISQISSAILVENSKVYHFNDDIMIESYIRK